MIFARFFVTAYFYDQATLISSALFIFLVTNYKPSTDPLGTFGEVLVYLSPFTFLFSPLGYISFGMDAFYYTHSFFLSNSAQVSSFIMTALFFFRLIICGIWCIEIFRIFFFTFISLLFAARAVREISSRLNLIQNHAIFGHNLIILRLFYSQFAFVAEPLVAILMGCGLFFGVCANYAVLKMGGVLPGLFYVVAVGVAGMIPLIVGIILPVGIDVHENTRDGIETRMTGSGKGYLFRKYRAMRPLTFMAGVADFRLIKVVKSVRGGYYGRYVDYSVTTMLCFPTVG